MEITIGYSTCPNDTFIFDALINGKIDTGNLVFKPYLADVEELNTKAFKQELAVTKLSYHAYSHLTNAYVLSNSGSALGDNVGPLVICKPGNENTVNPKIAIPGKYTTANFLFSLAYPEKNNKYEIIFSKIEEEVLNQNADWGLVIHESRFTYQEKGLCKVNDLGNFWQNTFNAPIPLGGIAIKRSLAPEVIRQIDSLIKLSVEYAFKNPASVMPYVRAHAQDMRDEVMMNHIKLYVNAYTYDLKEIGRNAVVKMFRLANEKGIIPDYNPHLFVNPAT